MLCLDTLWLRSFNGSVTGLDKRGSLRILLHAVVLRGVNSKQRIPAAFHLYPRSEYVNICDLNSLPRIETTQRTGVFQSVFVQGKLVCKSQCPGPAAGFVYFS